MSKKEPSKSVHDTQKTDTYEVGYCKPPKRNQFKPGQSGNPKGRPKGALNVETIVRNALVHRIKVREDGKTRKITAFEAMVLRQREKACNGDRKALDFLCQHFKPEEDAGGGDVLDGDDQEMFDALMRKVAATEAEDT